MGIGNLLPARKDLLFEDIECWHRFNFRIQGHKKILVGAEGSYTDQSAGLPWCACWTINSFITTDQKEFEYYIVASPIQVNTSINGVVRLHYKNSDDQLSGPLPKGLISWTEHSKLSRPSLSGIPWGMMDRRYMHTLTTQACGTFARNVSRPGFWVKNCMCWCIFPPRSDPAKERAPPETFSFAVY